MVRELAAVAGDAERCAEYYKTSPGLAGADAIIDLYHSVARLARAVVLPDGETWYDLYRREVEGTYRAHRAEI
ncbi:hypothetical protein [Brevundimonas sp.]|uniref:hypothetical protein n=1 Tax=Brevundimonas sp. TaxID=1871086 RepID=UPI002D3E04C9|nr:hypothetical protein [Brevundimonas sp.]HYD29223.1 hypothetical protein [Brevundimonas sp.]